MISGKPPETSSRNNAKNVLPIRVGGTHNFPFLSELQGKRKVYSINEQVFTNTHYMFYILLRGRWHRKEKSLTQKWTRRLASRENQTSKGIVTGTWGKAPKEGMYRITVWHSIYSEWPLPESRGKLQRTANIWTRLWGRRVDQVGQECSRTWEGRGECMTRDLGGVGQACSTDLMGGWQEKTDSCQLLHKN